MDSYYGDMRGLGYDIGFDDFIGIASVGVWSRCCRPFCDVAALCFYEESIKTCQLMILHNVIH